MADFTLLNLTAKNDTMTRNQVLQQSLPMGEDDTLYFFQESPCMETPYYNQGGFNHNHTAMVHMVREFFMENPYYNNHTAMVPMAQEFYMETSYYNQAAMVPTAQRFYMETPYYYNHAAMVPMAQRFYMETAYYNYNYNNNNHAVMVPMAQEFYMETPYYNPVAMVPMAQKFYKKTSNYSTTVVPLTQEWMSRLHTNMDNGYGSTWIMEKFLTSVSECVRETPPTYQDASVQEFASQCNSGVGNNQKSWTSQPIARNRFGETVSEDANNRTTSEVTQPQAAPPSKTGKNCSNGTVKASVCLSPSNKLAGDGSELKRLEEAELLHSPDIEGWVFWSRSEAGSIYYSEDEMSEEMTGHSIGPDVDRMEEKLVFPTPSMPDRLVNSEDWVFWSRSEAGSIYYSEDEMSEGMTGHSIGPDVDRMEEKLVFPTPSVPDRLPVVNKSSDYPSEELHLLDHIEVDHQSDGTEDLEEMQLLDFIKQLQLDHSSDGTEENFQLLDPFEMPGLCLWQNSVPEHEVVTTNRLSRYDLHHGPTHRVQSPSCPLIGARGDSRERSVYRDGIVPPALPQVAVQHQQVNGIVARTTKGKTVKPVANKTSYYSSHTTPMVNPPLHGCPNWLLLIGLFSLLIATADVKQKLGKLLVGGRLGQPHNTTSQTTEHLTSALYSENISVVSEVAWLSFAIVTDNLLSGIPLVAAPLSFAPTSVNPNSLSFCLEHGSLLGITLVGAFPLRNEYCTCFRSGFDW